MSVEEALGRMRLLLARRSVVARRLAAAADGPGEVRSPRLDGMPRGHGTRGGTLAVLGRMEALADECAEIEGELRALSARVEGPILALPPGPHRLVMRLRYLEWRAVSDVANGAGYERRYTYKLLEEGNGGWRGRNRRQAGERKGARGARRGERSEGGAGSREIFVPVRGGGDSPGSICLERRGGEGCGSI